MSFYSIISAALQRRVWIGPEELPIFPNLYIILVGEPGTGKGLVIKPSTEVLRYHKVNPKLQSIIDNAALEEEGSRDVEFYKEVQEQLAALSGTKLKRGSGGYIEENLLFPLGSDSTTFEALVEQHKKARSFIRTDKPSKVLAPNCRYMHNSLSLVMEEISTLFRKKAEDVVKYLLKAYDCGHFEYRTVGRGVDCIRNPCLGILGGTTPTFLIDSFTDKLLNEGFASRTLFVYDLKPRFWRFGIPAFTDEQLQARNHIVEHIKNLSMLFGPVNYSPEALAFFKYYFEKVLPYRRVNESEKLNSYYARKNITGPKLAMAIHFADNATDFTLTLKECELALAILDDLEAKMHLAFQGGDTDFSRTCSKIVKYLENVDKISPEEGRALREIWKNFPMKECELIDTIRYLGSVGKIVEGKNKLGEVTYKMKYEDT